MGRCGIINLATYNHCLEGVQNWQLINVSISKAFSLWDKVQMWLTHPNWFHLILFIFHMSKGSKENRKSEQVGMYWWFYFPNLVFFNPYVILNCLKMDSTMGSTPLPFYLRSVVYLLCPSPAFEVLPLLSGYNFSWKISFLPNALFWHCWIVETRQKSSVTVLFHDMWCSTPRARWLLG